MTTSQEEPENALAETSLQELPQRLQDACARAGWSELMPVQARSLPYLFAQRDLMIQSRTGSGKTGAFLLPILDRIDIRLPACQALVLVPTRELAKQVEREAGLLAGNSGVRTVAVYGGTAYGPQISAFERGAHLVVGTPGRILDHLLRGTLTLDEIQILVLDEADRMLSMGFYPDMKRVRGYMPRRPINSYLFSATFPIHVIRLASEFLQDPETLSLSRDHVHVTDVLHVFYAVPARDKDRCLVRILEVENPVAAIVFCNTKRMVHYVSVVLQRFGWDADELSADLGQRDRERVMQRVRDGKLRVLVATDVAGRGIDIPELSHVIQYEPPEDTESYVHRAGRTGRAGASGRAITLASKNSIETVTLERIARQFEIDLQERPVPTEDDVRELVSQRLTARLEAEFRTRGQVERERLERFVPLARHLSEVDDETVLLAMVLDDWYQRNQRAPDPEEGGSAGDEPDRPARPAEGRSGEGRASGGGRGGRSAPREDRGGSGASGERPRRRRRRGGGGSGSGG